MKPKLFANFRFYRMVWLLFPLAGVFYYYIRMDGLLGSALHSSHPFASSAIWDFFHYLMLPGIMMLSLVAAPLLKIAPTLTAIPGLFFLLFEFCQFAAGWIISRPFKWIEEYRRKKKKPSVPDEL